jgi:hypothetical protein
LSIYINPLSFFCPTPLSSYRSESTNMSLGITPIVQVTMADSTTPTNLVDKVAALDIKHSGERVASSPGTVTPSLSNPLSPVSPTAPGPSPFGSLAGVKDDGTNIGGAGARKASVHERDRMSFTTTGGRKGSSVGSRRPSRRGSGVVVTPSGQQQVFHTRTNVSSLSVARASESC